MLAAVCRVIGVQLATQTQQLEEADTQQRADQNWQLQWQQADEALKAALQARESAELKCSALTTEIASQQVTLVCILLLVLHLHISSGAHHAAVCSHLPSLHWLSGAVGVAGVVARTGTTNAEPTQTSYATSA